MGSEMMRATCLYPCPGVDETERQRRLEEHRKNIWANGCVIESEKRVHNPVFDKKGEKTTTQMIIRPVKNDSEAEFILHKLGIK